MLGVWVNVGAIVVGAVVGYFFKRLISEETGKRIEMTLGYCVIVIGVRMALDYHNVLMLVGCVVIGGLLGKWADLEKQTERISKKVQFLFAKQNHGDRFATGLSISSILFCTGAMAVVGSIQSGAIGDHEVLFAKATLDGVVNISFAAIYGLGVALAAVPVLLYQGTIALLASQVSFLTNELVIKELSGVGGVLIIMIGVTLTGIRRVPVADFLPAILLVLIASALIYT